MVAVRQPLLIESTPDILFVEDDADDAKLTLSILEERGFGERVAHVGDGAEAFDFIASTRGAPMALKLILLDFDPHKMGALHVLKQLKSDARTKAIPVVVLTSSRMAIEFIESHKLGVNSYVIKPIDADKFAEIISQIGHYWLLVNEPPPQ